MAEEKKKAGGLKGMYKKGGGEKKPRDPKSELVAKPKAEGGGGPEKPGAAAAAPSPGERHGADRAAMFKRHETELRDAHGNHRDNLRKIVERQGKEIKEMNAAHSAEMASAAAPPAEGNAP